MASSAGFSKSTSEPLFSFGLMADCQYVDADPKGSRFYRESPRKLEEAITELNHHDLAFSFHLGDFIDRDLASFDDLSPIATKLRSELFHALGNHDFDVPDEAKAGIPARLGLNRGYYSFSKDGFRFIVIDTTEVSNYRHPKNSRETRLATAEMERYKAAKSVAAKPWNSRPGDDQIKWLEAELEAASSAEETVLVLGHHPIIPTTGHSVWNATELDAILQRHTCAKLYLNGHNHAGLYAESEGLHYLTLDGMVETKEENAFAYADLYADRLEITGFGRQESHVLKFR